MNELTTCQSSESVGVGLERTRFFPRQLITPDDLTQDQLYFREKTRRHNRLLHGWGVVCGARVRQGAGDCEIVIEPGYILGPFGDEIMIDQEVKVDLCRESLDGNAVSPCGDLLDPWCSDVRVNRRAGQVLYVAVKYAECQSRPVRVQANGCGCNEQECEYSRIRDSFAVKVLTSLPSTYADPMPQPDSDGIVRCEVTANGEVVAPSCPPCPTEPWVILADVMLNGEDGVKINCFAHRRYVASFANFYYLCRPREVRPKEQATLTDRTAELRAEAAKALVQAKRRDGSALYVPIYAEIEAGETYGSYLAREGKRELYDDATNTSYTLRELYQMAGVNPNATIRTAAEAAAPLEGLVVDRSALLDTQDELEAHLDMGGTERLDKEYAGAPAKAADLPATDIRGVSSRSTLGRKVADLKIADIAAQSREQFVATVTKGVSAKQVTAVENQAGDVWDKAKQVVDISKTWRNA
ncbi:MAG: hypothetical protein IAF02_12540 [Anaerolineae bacterium]|nr:hypothetical protein [Anaerolineae bacterium]